MTHRRIQFRNFRFLLLLCGGSPQVPAQAPIAALEDAVAIAQANDPWLVGSEQREAALRSRRTAAGSLPDPVVSIGLANLPVDGFDFNQEQMTQAMIGVSQLLPRGDTLSLAQRKLDFLGSQQPFERENRREWVRRDVSLLWLSAHRAQQTISTIEGSRALFEYLVDASRSRFASAAGRTYQQDVVRAQVELTRLEDRLQVLRMQRDTALARLGEWLLPDGAGEFASAAGGIVAIPESEPPPVELRMPDVVHMPEDARLKRLEARLQQHPSVLSLQARIDATQADVAIAEQLYRPQWRLNASYGYRDDSPTGMDRADFFSVGLAFDVPLFTAKRQDPQVRAAAADAAAVRTERTLLLRRLLSAVRDRLERLKWLERRAELYSAALLQQMHEQAEASLGAYTNDEGDFAEVVRARIAELNARVDALNIEVDRQATIAELNYYLATSRAGREARS